jgi:NADPH:quinone reductase-like Zn-dependent oxidoreductase
MKRDFMPLFAAGRLKPLITKTFAFADLPKAKDYMESDAGLGKIVVRMATAP